MLQSLHVKNLALIDEAEVEFGAGLNIFSGETGAGKSILIGSLNLALGEKVPKEMIRENAEYALVELVFHVEDEKIRKQLLELDVIPENDEVIMSRRISPLKSTGRINSETVSASRMREVAGLLIDLYGQNEHQSLLHRQKHLEILDSFAKDALKEVMAKLPDAYQDYKKTAAELAEATTDESQRARERSFLEYEIAEIEEANLKVGEDEELEDTYRRMTNLSRIRSAVDLAYQMTSGAEGADARIGRAVRELSGIAEYDERIRELVDQLGEVDNLLNDCNRELSEYLSEAEYSDEAFEETDRRLNEINHLKEKYGSSITAILAQKEEKQERLDKLLNYEDYLEELKNRAAKAEETLRCLCEEASGIRKKEAVRLEEQMTRSLLELNFLDARVQIAFARTPHYTSHGYDEPEFMIATNPGEPLKPLAKIASGGELSRIMLALKTILSENDGIETMIFDEIDAGISGRTAQMVAQKMNEIARNHQVICITHLPQIAAMADTHFLIEKSVIHENTHSTIHKLDEENSVRELARMLGGVEVTDTVLKSAKEMRQMARKVKADHVLN